jgi:hypothetical protein
MSYIFMLRLSHVMFSFWIRRNNLCVER